MKIGLNLLIGLLFFSISASAITISSAEITQTREPDYQSLLEIPEVFRTQDWPGCDVDSVAAWVDKNNEVLIFITAKETDEIYVCNGLTGEKKKTIGKSGSELGQFKRPNGIAVFGDYLFVVERDNRRVQVFEIPSMKPLFCFGENELRKPYGVATIIEEDGTLALYVTDDFDLPQEPQQRRDLLSERVKQYSVDLFSGEPKARWVRSFGEKEGPGALQVVESIAADPVAGTLWICDEEDHAIKLYDLQGKYLGKNAGKGVIRDDAEGIAVYIPPDEPERRWMILSDQGKDLTRLRIFSIKGDLLATFGGKPPLANTDGLTLLQGDFEGFPKGILYCIHDDIRLHAYSLEDIVQGLEGSQDGKPQ